MSGGGDAMSRDGGVRRRAGLDVHQHLWPDRS